MDPLWLLALGFALAVAVTITSLRRVLAEEEPLPVATLESQDGPIYLAEVYDEALTDAQVKALIRKHGGARRG